MAVALLFAVNASAFATEKNGGMYFAVMSGKTYGLSGLENGASATALAGYKFNPIFAAEGGYTSLANNTNANNLPNGITGNSSVAGADVAAVINVPVSQQSVVFARLGYAYMMVNSEITNLGTKSTLPQVDFSGATYGLGVKYYLGSIFTVSAGFNAYQLKNVSCLTATACTISPSNVYAAIGLQF